MSATNVSVNISSDEVVAMLRGLLEKAIEVEADVGVMPTAEEALGWAIAKVEEMATASAD